MRSVSVLNFLCAFTMLLPFKVCFMHYIWTLRSYTCIPYFPTYSNIEKYCYRSYLFFVTECVQWKCVIECATYKPNILLYTQKQCVNAKYLFNNYFDSSIRTRNRMWTPGLRVQNLQIMVFILFIFLPGRKSYDFSHYCCTLSESTIHMNVANYKHPFLVVLTIPMKSEVDYPYVQRWRTIVVSSL